MKFTAIAMLIASATAIRLNQKAATAVATMEGPQTLREVFNYIDADSNGNISLEELLAVVRAHPEAQEIGDEAWWTNQFNQADTNNSDSVDFAEFRAAVEAAQSLAQGETDSHQQEIVQYILELFDRNGNGVITANEVNKTLTQQARRERREVERAFRDADVDGDERVTTQELTNAVAAYFENGGSDADEDSE